MLNSLSLFSGVDFVISELYDLQKESFERRSSYPMFYEERLFVLPASELYSLSYLFIHDLRIYSLAICFGDFDVLRRGEVDCSNT
jgi:hypothetical protein